MSENDEDMMDDDFESDEELDFNDEDEGAMVMAARTRSPLESRRQLERRRELNELRRLLDDPYLELD
ncbi:MAG: hypothetical protein H6926_04005 [Chromatiales bacterium]|nr:hypothetical protein [Gammaproteobacteria bacterium]MCP5352339.1 hypothetical protein [Chromatiales bacterium]